MNRLNLIIAFFVVNAGLCSAGPLQRHLSNFSEILDNPASRAGFKTYLLTHRETVKEDCTAALDKVTKALGGIPEREVYFDATSSCSSTVGKELHPLEINMLMEAKSEQSSGALEAYLKKHQGEIIFADPLKFWKAEGLISRIEIKFGDYQATSIKYSAWPLEYKHFYVTYGESYLAMETFGKNFGEATQPEPLLLVLGKMFPTLEIQTYRKEVMEKSNWGESANWLDVIQPSKEISSFPMAHGNLRDCRKNPNNHCA